MSKSGGKSTKIKRGGAYLTFLRVFACFTAFLMLVLIGVEASTLISDATWRQWTPDYDFADLTATFEKSQSELTEDDYALLYAQTGLTKIGADRLWNSDSGKNRIRTIQKCYMEKVSVYRERFAPWTCWEKLEEGKNAAIGAVREGDTFSGSVTGMRRLWYRTTD